MAFPADLIHSVVLIAFASVLAGSLGVPVPTFAAVIIVGSILADQHASVEMDALVFAAGMAGAVIGDIAWFLAGRRYGPSVLALICRLSLSRDTCVRRTADLFSRRGVRLLLFSRFVPGLSVISAPLAGISGVGLARFLAFAESGTTLWLCVSLALGFCFAGQVASVLALVARFGLGLGGLAVVLIVLYVGVSWFRRQLLLRQLSMSRISADELAPLVAAGPAPLIIDARSAFDRLADPFTIPGAEIWESFVPAQHLSAASLLRPVIIFCSCPNEISAAIAAKRLRRMGFSNVRPLREGIEAWRAAGHPVQALAGPDAPARPANDTAMLFVQPAEAGAP